MKVHLTRFDGGLRIKNSPPYVLKFLKYSHREMKSVNYKRQSVFIEKLLYSHGGENEIFTLAGFYDDVVALLKKHMDLYETEDFRTPLPEADWHRIRAIKLRDYQMEPVLDLVFKGTEQSGVINATGGFGKTHIQAVTYAAWNRLNTILAIPLKQVAIQTYEKFKTFFPDKHVGFIGDGKNDISSDITISTFRSLKNCALEKCQLLLVDEMQSAGQESFQMCLKTIKPIRVFGYSATTDGMFNNTDKLLKGVFGPDLIYYPYEEAETAGAVVPGVVYMVRMPDNYIMENYTSFEAKFKHGIKRCDVRNELIGKACAAIPEGWQTIVFIDHVKDHLVPLYKYLPAGTKFLHRETSKKSVGSFALSPKQQNETIDDFSNNRFKILVASDAFRAGVDIPNCRVVVQASGGSSKVEVLQEAYRGSRILTEEYMERFGLEPKTHFVLVDFMDNHDPSLEAMAEKRIKYYSEQGWKIKYVNRVDEIDWQSSQ
jgi:superfamily II DNA or RNA helicase